MPYPYFRYLILLFALILSGCFGLLDSGSDHITGSYYTGWIDVYSSRYLEKRDSAGNALEMIPAYVYAVGHTDRFIAAKQHPSPDPFHERVDVGATNYYLIDIKFNKFDERKSLYGPMNADEFSKLCYQLHTGPINFDLTYPEQP